MTVVRPHLQWGVAELGGDGRVEGFVEKPRSEHWINGGFFCFEPGALDYLDEDSVLEREPLERLAADGQLRAYRHEGFWDCMDTYKDAVVLNDLWAAGEAPWTVWDDGRGGVAVKPGAGHRGHGFVASHLARALLERGERRVIDRSTRWPTSAAALSGLDLLGIERRGRAGRGRPARRAMRSRDRRVGRVRRRSSTSPRRRSSASRDESPVGDLRGQRARRPGTSLEACRAHDVPARRLRLLRQGLRAQPRSCPTARTSRCGRPPPTTRARRRPTSIARSYATAYGLPVAVTRFANIYGGGDLNFSRLIPETVVAVLDGRRPVIRSDGSPERDFLYVDDAVAAYLAIARALGAGGRGAGEAFNAGGERPHSVREVVELIAAAAGAERRARLSRAPATRPARSTASSSTRPSCAS